MSNLVTVPHNGTIANKTKNNFTNLSHWFDDMLNRDIPSVFNHLDYEMPKVNIKENAEAFTVELAVPGFDKKDFKLDLDHKVLSISAEIKEETENKEENYSRKEFGYASFKRTFTLPDSVDDEAINASYKDGVLSILLPKKEEAKQKPVRSIKIT
ncbi:Hsp20/alpha crystallin family protein [Aurantibacter aestuarii]|uniref:Heat-shock protein n=1 Tax=Aurantibacter aestuarii TaxID=1266046 RepID=A0A2T1NA38_9FLAO|nr:Hsp20/alpha crystallin family protein [Aurantibacter aestuarii]PSG88715.1 heat-shock protein [Aurantibacter aestuarii]